MLSAYQTKESPDLLKAMQRTPPCKLLSFVGALSVLNWGSLGGYPLCSGDLYTYAGIYAGVYVCM